MTASKQVKDFFIKKIQTVMRDKIEQVMDGVDEEKAKDISLIRFCSELGNPQLPLRLQKLEQQKRTLKEDEEKIEQEVREILSKQGESFLYNPIDTLRVKAYRRFLDIILHELYPQKMEEKYKFESIMLNAEAAVLLATSEPKIVTVLTRLLEKHGGEIAGLLDILDMD